MEHAEATLNLLESTQSAVTSNIMLKMDAVMDEVDPEFKAEVENMLGSYMQSCLTAGMSLKSDLHEMKTSQEGLQKILDDMAQGIAFVTKKPKAKKTKKQEYDDETSFDIEEDEDLFPDSGEDSDWNPTPKTSKRRRSKRLATTDLPVESPSSNDQLFG